MRRHIVLSFLLAVAIGFLAVATTSADNSPLEVGVVWLLLVLAVVGLIALIRWLYRVTFGRRKKPSAKTETPLFTATPLPPSPPRIDQTPALEQTPTSSMQQPQIVEPKPSMQPSAAVSTNPSDRTYCPKCNQETCAMVRFCPECGYQLRSD
jgi:type IV secretory pathway VirB10-like protein